MRRLIVCLMFTLVALAGCQPGVVRGPGASGYLSLVGAQVEVLRAVPIALGEARAFLQHGVLVPSGRRDRFQPSCAFEVNTLSDGGMRVEPGMYGVTRVERELIEVVEFGAAVQVASRGTLAGISDDAGSPLITVGIHLYLDAGPTSDARRLSCLGTEDDLGDAMAPTLEEMNAALDGFARILI